MQAWKTCSTQRQKQKQEQGGICSAAGEKQVPLRLRRFGMTSLNCEDYLAAVAEVASDSAVVERRSVSQSVLTRSHSWIMMP